MSYAVLAAGSDGP